MQLIRITIILFIWNFLSAQELVYQKFDVEDGLPSLEFYKGISMEDGTYWFASDQGMVSYDGVRFINYGIEDGLTSLGILDMYKINEEKFIVSAIDGTLCIWEKGKFSAFKFNSTLNSFLKNGNWIGFVKVENQEIYFIHQKSKGKVFKINMHSGTIKEIEVELFKIGQNEKGSVFDSDLKELGGISKSSALVYLRKRKAYQNQVIFHFENSLVIYDKKSKKCVFKILNQYINSFTIQDHYLWLCTAKGLLKYNLNQIDEAPIKYFSDKSVTNFLKIPDQGFWAITKSGLYLVENDKMIHCFEEEKSQIEYDNFNIVEDRLLCQNKRLNILIDMDSKAEYSDINVGSFSFNDTSNGLRFYRKVFKDGRFSSENLIIEIKKHRLELNHFGLLLLKGEEEIKVVSGRPVKILKWKEELYLSTLKGFYRIYDEDGILNKENLKAKNDWGEGYIRDFAILGDALVLGVRGKGLMVYEGGVINNLEYGEELNELINNIHLENDSILWVASNSGVDKLTLGLNENLIKLKGFSKFTQNHGLSTNLVNDIIIWKDSIFLATGKGVLKIDKRDWSLNEKPPVLELTSIKVNSNTFNLDSLQKLKKLRHLENDLSLEFISKSLKNPIEKNRYRYCLKKEKEEHEWSFTNSNSLQFANLDYGHYEFELQSRTENGIWSDPLTIPIKIAPHFTDTIWFWIGLTLSLFLVGGYLIRNYFKVQEEKRKTQYQLLSAEMSTLRSQMNPHFVFNALNSMQGYIFNEDKRSASRFLHKFSQLIRNSLNYSKSEYISLEQELEFIKTYLEIESVRFENKFNYAFNIGDAKTRALQIPPLILQPIVENVIKHAFNNIDHKGRINIKCIRKDDLLEVIVLDNGKGMKKEDLLKEQSFGISNIKKRLQILGHHDGNEYLLKINEHLEDGWTTSVGVELPIKLINLEHENINS